MDIAVPETAPFGDGVINHLDQIGFGELIDLRNRLTRMMREERKWLSQDPCSQFSGRRLKELSYQRDLVRSEIASRKRWGRTED